MTNNVVILSDVLLMKSKVRYFACNGRKDLGCDNILITHFHTYDNEKENLNKDKATKEKKPASR